MSAFDSIFAAAEAQLFTAFGRSDIVYSALGFGPETMIKAVVRTGEPVSSQQQEAYAFLFMMEADLPNFPRKGDTFRWDGVTYILAKEPLDCQDGQGGLNLRLRKT